MTLLRNLNLNLMPVLRELLRNPHVTQAARELNMSQPAVSSALNRLRAILHDELLIPSGRTFVLSAMARRVQPQLENALIELENLLAPAAFDPASGTGKMRIATSDYVVLLTAPSLSQKFREQARSMSVEFVYAHAESNDDLQMGEIDMIIAPAGQNVGDSDQFNRTRLYEDELVYLVATDGGEPRFTSVEDLSLRPHVFCDPRGRPGSNSFAETVLRQRNPYILEAARVPSFMLVPFLIEGTDNVALLQHRLAKRLAPLTKTTIIVPPEDFPKVHVMAAWNRSREHDPAHMWLRTLLSEASTELDFS